jgi:hypothetical protein
LEWCYRLFPATVKKPGWRDQWQHLLSLPEALQAAESQHFAAASTFNQAMKKTELNLPIIAFPQLA